MTRVRIYITNLDQIKAGVMNGSYADYNDVIIDELWELINTYIKQKETK